MKLEDNPLIRRTLLPQPDPDPYAEPRARLWSALRQFRERAAVLANEIHRDLPEFTVHDITHLDALWEMADLIAGPDYPLNPLEAFALGGVFLLHDLGLGLAAWPGGLEELKKGPGWEDALSTYLRKHLDRIPRAEELASPPPEIERAAVADRLRALHAEQAERLALASFPANPGKDDPIYHLIDNPDLRHAIGPLLGKIARSHWWPVSRLGSEFGTRRGALPDCPREWELDPLKIAVLLRTADAAHLDARRAPGFLLALRRPEGLSENHWRFQNYLLKPRLQEDRIIYTTARPFPAKEVDDWWLCEETLRVVDSELHQVDAMLADLGRPRLKARGVAGTESPDRLMKYVEVSGWAPVDARLHVSNVADLVKRLGGEQLYGDDPTVPLRELIQNAADAVRARRILENLPGNWGRVTVRLGQDDGAPWIEVEDTGIGMSEVVLKGPLLDFGTTYWSSALMKEEHEGLWGKGFEPTGRFGVGFFSVFMWGSRVRVSTRRYKKDSEEGTRVLEFQTGAETRPLIRRANQDELLQEGGTRVRVWLNKNPSDRGGLLRLKRLNYPGGDRLVTLNKLCAWLAPALDIDLFVAGMGVERQVIAASDWLTIGAHRLFSRISVDPIDSEDAAVFGRYIRKIESDSGQVLGRLSIYYPSSFGLGVVTVGGLRAGSLFGAAGLLVGSAGVRASRDSAVPLASGGVLKDWACSQGRLVKEGDPSEHFQMICASSIVLYGGDPGGMPIAFGRMGYVREADLPDVVAGNGELVVMPDFNIYPDVYLKQNVIEVFMAGTLSWLDSSRSMLHFIADKLASILGCEPAEIEISDASHYGIGFRDDGTVERSVISVYILRRRSRSRVGRKVP